MELRALWIKFLEFILWSLDYAKRDNNFVNNSMTPSRIEIVLPMAGSQMPAMLQRVLATTLLIQHLGLLERSMWIEMYLVSQSPTSCPILLISFVPWQRRISELNTLSSQVKLPVLNRYGVGDLIRASISTSIIAIYLSISKAMKMVRSLISHY